MNAPDFKTSFENRTEELEFLSTGMCPSCTDCQYNFGESEEGLQAGQDDGSISDEGSFSWSACDTCGSTWGGNRYDAHAIIRKDPRPDWWCRCDAFPETHKETDKCPGTKKLIHLDVCEDCYFFINNGDEPEGWTQHPD